MSTEVLRRAADRMRERAEAATPGPWAIDTDPDYRHHVRTGFSTTDIPAKGEAVADFALDEDAAHVASWHPVVAIAVADWLDTTARDVGTSSIAYHAALAVARAYLGER